MKQKPEPFPLNEKQKRYRLIANFIDCSFVLFGAVLVAIMLIFKLKDNAVFIVFKRVYQFGILPTMIATNILYEKGYPSR